MSDSSLLLNYRLGLALLQRLVCLSFSTPLPFLQKLPLLSVSVNPLSYLCLPQSIVFYQLSYATFPFVILLSFPSLTLTTLIRCPLKES